MIQNYDFPNKHLFLKLGMFFGICLLILILMIIFSMPNSSAITKGSVQATSTEWINETSGPRVVLDVTLHNNTGGVYNNLTWIKVTFYNVSGFVPTTNLTPLSNDASSGVIIYNETNGIPGFQKNDSEIIASNSGWGSNSTHYWVTFNVDSGFSLPMNDPGSPNVYVALQTSVNLNDNTKFYVNISTNDINATWGNAPPTTGNSLLIKTDTQDPKIDGHGVTESSDFIFYNYTTNTIWYGDDMTSAQSFDVNGTASDTGGSGLSHATFSKNGLATAGNPVNDTNPATWVGTYNNVDSGDTISPGTITVKVFDKAGNNKTWTYTVTRDTDIPNISFTGISESSDYIYWSGSVLYYRNNVGGMSESFTIVLTDDESGSGRYNASGEDAFGGPSWDIDYSNSQWDISYVIDQSDSCNSPLTITVTDNVGNSDTYNLQVTLDNTGPTITSPQVVENSPYIYSYGAVPIRIYYGNKMGGDEWFRVEGSASDSGSGLYTANFTNCDLGSPSNDTASPATWVGNYSNVGSGDSFNGWIDVYVYDNVNNSNLYRFRVYRDIADPNFQYNTPSEGENTSWYGTDPGKDIDIDFIQGGNAQAPILNASYRIGSDPWVDIFITVQLTNYISDWGINWSNTTEGLNEISLRVYDCVGNYRYNNYSIHTLGFGFLKDTLIPSFTYNNPTAGSQTPWSRNTTGDFTVDIDFGTMGSPLMSAQYRINGGSWIYIFNSEQSSNYTMNWGIPWSSLSEGNNDIDIMVTNKVGSSRLHTFSLSQGFRIRKDSVAPGITYNSPTVGGSTNWLKIDPGTTFLNIDFIWIGNSRLVNASYRIGNGPWVEIFSNLQSSDYTTDWSIPWNSLSNGVNEISIKAYDEAGNVQLHTYIASTSGFAFRKDTLATTITYNSPTAGGNTSWYSTDPGNIIDIDFIWDGYSPLHYAQYRIGTGTWIYIFNSQQSSSYLTNWSIQFDQLAEGENEISIRVVDVAGNTAIYTYLLDINGFIFKKDTVGPETTSISINNGATYTNSSLVTLTISASDSISGIYQMRLSNDGVFDTEPWEDYSTTRQWTLTSGDGTKTVYIMFRDYALATSSTLDIIILDATLPTITDLTRMPGNVTEDTTGHLNITVNVTDGSIGSGILSVKINYTINGITYDTFENMIHSTGNQWYFNIDIESLGYTWNDLQENEITFYLQVSDNAGNSRLSSAYTEYIDPINDPPRIIGLPESITLVIGDDYILDLTTLISDEESATSDLILTTDSNYATISGKIITFNYPSKLDSGTITITVSDGLLSTNWQIQIKVLPKIITITQDYVTAKILLTSIGQITPLTDLMPPGVPPDDLVLIGNPFNISFIGAKFDWMYLMVDYSNADISAVTESTFMLYYWDASTSSWKVCVITSPDIPNKIVTANVTQPGTFVILGQLREDLPDNDGDNIPDTIDPDDDNDGMLDIYEGQYSQLNPFLNDSYGDLDSEGLTNLQESQLGSDPTDKDTDDDEMDDRWEFEYNFNLLDPSDADDDPDNDGYSNLEEYKAGSDPLDDKSVPKPSDTDEDQILTYIAIIIVIIIILLLLLFMMFRYRARPGAEVEELPGGPSEEEEFEEVRPDMADEYELESEFEPDEEEVGVLKPEVATITIEGIPEVYELGVAETCGVCQGLIPVGKKVFNCSCGLTSHLDHLGEITECPQCGRELDLEELGIVVAEEEILEKPRKPSITREIKREIKEVALPDSAYFVYIPEQTSQGEITNYVQGYLKNRKTGRVITQDLSEISIFIDLETAKKMMDHCYKKGKQFEVMGLIVGETYKHNNTIFSIARDVVTSELDATEVNVRFESFDELFDQLEGLTYDYQILGWYHSHPDYSSFMSPTDVDTQKRMFNQPHQFAIVIDPIQYDMKAFVVKSMRKRKATEQAFAVISLDKFMKQLSEIPPSDLEGKLKAISKPVIRNEVKQKISELKKSPERSYLTYIPGITNEGDVKGFLKDYFVKHKAGKAILTSDLVENIGLFLTLDSAKKMLDHCFKYRNDKEVMGLMMGRVYRFNDKTFSLVKDVVTSELNASVVNVRFNSFEKLFNQLDNLKYDYQIVGWYHSHPGHTCFMSPTDENTQKRMFKHSHQYALVVDPINNDMKAFSLDQKTKTKVKSRGFAIVDFKD